MINIMNRCNNEVIKLRSDLKSKIIAEKTIFCSSFGRKYSFINYCISLFSEKNKRKMHLQKIQNIKNQYKKMKANIVDSFENKKKNNIKNRKIKDFLLSGNSSVFFIFSIGMLIWIIAYVFANGSSVLTWDFITGPYSNQNYTLVTNDDFLLEDNLNYSDIDLSKENVSKKWGVSFKYIDDDDSLHIDKISINSPFFDLIDIKSNQNIDITKYKYGITYISMVDNNGSNIIAYANDGIEEFINNLDRGVKIIDSSFIVNGGGIYGSLLTTLSLIGLTLLISFPIGIGGAIYLSIYAKNTKFTKIIRMLIDMTSGIPSIIFGLAGALIFIPFTSSMIGSTGGNLISGALTMTMILLPTIVKTVEESIMVIPNNIIHASYALGASRSETIFKIILPNAIPGILTSLLLSIGRIIGESAALVFALGSTISDTVSLGGSNATLAVHIWYIMGGENPAFDSACAISIIIISIVLVLSLITKIISFKANKFKKGR